MASVREQILELTKQLYPKGRSFGFFKGSFLEAIHKGLSYVEAQAYNDALSVINNSLLPDNDGFTLEDALIWEEKLGINIGTGTTLEDRKKAILRKWNFPGEVSARQHRLFIQNQLNLAGFDVVIYENRFLNTDTNKLESLSSESVLSFQHGEFEHGELEHGEFQAGILANYVDKERDLTFNIGSNFRSTFFIASSEFGSIDGLGVTTMNLTSTSESKIAEIPQERESEFRELLLKLKPAQTVALLFVKYI